jgi:perosamine synthetase
MSNSSLPAILGGTPERTRPFIVEPMIDKNEERLVVAAIRAKNFSRYIGSNSPDLETSLRLPSAEAAAIEADWHFLGGPNVRNFAAEFSAAFDVPFAVPVSSATTGLSIALGATGITPGDEVILPAISFSATASAVLLFNAIPIFVDVDPLTFCLDPAAVEAAITPATKAILLVHLLGNLADMDALLDIAKRHGLKVIEDAAQAPGSEWRGAKAGTLGDAGVFSFQQSKNIMTGEGGMIVTHDAEIARRARLILNHGEVAFDETATAQDLANIIGLNARLPELSAALGRAQLAKLETVNDWRTQNADILRQELANLPGLTPSPSQRAEGGAAREVPHVFAALFEDSAMGISRERFVAALRAEGVPVGTGYPRTLYENPTFMQQIAYGSDGCPWTSSFSRPGVTYASGMCPIAEALLRERFIWFYHIAHASTAEDMRDIGRAVRKTVAAHDALAAAPESVFVEHSGHSQGRVGVAQPGSGEVRRS